jgi:hypothetical protein
VLDNTELTRGIGQQSMTRCAHADCPIDVLVVAARERLILFWRESSFYHLREKFADERPLNRLHVLTSLFLPTHRKLPRRGDECPRYAMSKRQRFRDGITCFPKGVKLCLETLRARTYVVLTDPYLRDPPRPAPEDSDRR